MATNMLRKSLGAGDKENKEANANTMMSVAGRTGIAGGSTEGGVSEEAGPGGAFAPLVSSSRANPNTRRITIDAQHHGPNLTRTSTASFGKTLQSETAVGTTGPFSDSKQGEDRGLRPRRLPVVTPGLLDKKLAQKQQQTSQVLAKINLSSSPKKEITLSVVTTMTRQTFLQKLDAMICEGSARNSEAIHWTCNGQAFVYTRSEEFTEFLKTYFNHSNASSFRGQLTNYGFTFGKAGKFKNMFHNPLFHRDRTSEEDLSPIKRNPDKKSKRKSVSAHVDTTAGPSLTKTARVSLDGNAVALSPTTRSMSKATATQNGITATMGHAMFKPIQTVAPATNMGPSTMSHAWALPNVPIENAGPNVDLFANDQDLLWSFYGGNHGVVPGQWNTAMSSSLAHVTPLSQEPFPVNFPSMPQTHSIPVGAKAEPPTIRRRPSAEDFAKFLGDEQDQRPDETISITSFLSREKDIIDESEKLWEVTDESKMVKMKVYDRDGVPSTPKSRGVISPIDPNALSRVDPHAENGIDIFPMSPLLTKDDESISLLMSPVENKQVRWRSNNTDTPFLRAPQPPQYPMPHVNANHARPLSLSHQAFDNRTKWATATMPAMAFRARQGPPPN